MSNHNQPLRRSRRGDGMVALTPPHSPDPEHGIRIVSRSGKCALALLAGGALALPGNPLLALVLIVAVAVATGLASRTLRRLASRRAAISARQDLTFAEELPR